MNSFGDRDRIILAGLAFYGYHGVMMEENNLGQRFRIDLELGLDMDAAALTDDVAQTISYADIYDLVKLAFEEKRFKLIEALGHHIIMRLFGTFEQLDWIRIRVRKPEAPLPIVVGEAAIEMVRTRAQVNG
ncbi:dihydroneopterin aldolase [Pelagibacterium lentulum]|uniref:7,8-dihydroneopterin aldolase n=1 Tax=Pelagibacterium lentulum TaxID=2029865 RepID=A0A916RNX7_9HYPH|nr:dihydroneopterin aldolase [Pelagibacterium lentulum]GGA63640.1 7,8-dihydroneopterin aldolase [Pelagibacterium lentulum]